MWKNALRLGLNALCNISTCTESPYAIGVLNGVKSVIEIGKDSDETCKTLGGRVLEISAACINSLPKEGVPDNFQAAYYIGQLMHVLDRITKKLVAHNQRGPVGKFILRSRDVATLKDLSEQLEQCAALLSLHLQMDNLRISTKMNVSTQLRVSEVEQAVAKAQKEELDLINSHFTMKSSQNISASHLPAPPQIFHGRSEDMQHILPVLLKDEASYVCILGTGGIGKTSFALSAIHHPEVVKSYDPFRYFIPCDALTDAAALLTTLASMFFVAEKEFWTRFPQLCRLLKHKILLILDNFETPWESAASRKAVEAFLVKLANIPNLSLILTLRGAERPYGVPWTRPFLQPLTPLDLTSAKLTFIEISDVSENSGGLEELLWAVEMLPLAVTLLASQAQVMACSNLLEMWKTQKTAMVTRGIQDRVSSLDVSIQISLVSPRLQQFPDALALLQILSVLPDGADDGGLMQMVPDNFDLATINAVKRVGLAYHNGAARLRSLSPVREHLQVFQPLSNQLFRGIASVHTTLASYANDKYYSVPGNVPEILEKISPQIGNLHSVLALSLEKTDLQREAAVAVAQIHVFHRMANFGPDRQLLNSALAIAYTLTDPVIEAECLLAMYLFDPRDISRKYLDRALETCRSVGDPVKISRCLVAIALVYTYKDPEKVIATAMEIIDHLPDAPLRTRMTAFDAIVSQYAFDGNFQTAWSLAQRALRTPHLSESARAKFLHSIADIHAVCGQLSMALERHIQIARIYDHLDDFHSSAYYEQIGQLYFMQSRLSLAASALNRAALVIQSTRSGYRSAVGPYFTALVAITAGDTPLVFSSCQLIHSIYLKGKENFLFSSQPLIVERALCCALAEIEMTANNWMAASIQLQSAKVSERKLGWISQYREVECLLRQADLFTATGLSARSLSPSVLAAILCVQNKDPFGLSMALQRIGDVFYREKGEIPHAKACYETEWMIIQDPYYVMGANRHAGDCLLRLGMVALKEGTPNEAIDFFQEAQMFYTTAENKAGVAFCESRALDLQNMNMKSTDDHVLPPLPLGNRLIAT